MFEDDETDTLTERAPAAEPTGPVSLGALTPLTAPEKVEALVDLQRQIGHLQHVAARLAASIGDEFPGPDDWGREEIAAALRISGYAADQLLRVGRALRTGLPKTARALDAGEISYRHAVVLVDAVGGADADTTESFEDTVLGEAVAETSGRFARALDRLVIKADPELAAARHAEAVADREIVLYPQPFGMETLAVTMPAEDTRMLFTAIDAQAGRKGPEDDRPIGARRADVLRDWARAALSGVAPSGSAGAGTATKTRHGRPVRINVTMTLGTLLGMAETPAELHGYGPITADAARALAGDAEWHALVVDAVTGAAQHVGTVAYRPNQALLDKIAVRDQRCAHPYCNQPAERCDTDHAIPWPDGETCECNCGPACRRHHRCKHEGGWQLTRDPDGTAHWTSPLGFRYDKRPAQYPVD